MSISLQFHQFIFESEPDFQCFAKSQKMCLRIGREHEKKLLEMLTENFDWFFEHKITSRPSPTQTVEFKNLSHRRMRQGQRFPARFEFILNERKTREQMAHFFWKSELKMGTKSVGGRTSDFSFSCKQRICYLAFLGSFPPRSLS